VIAISSKIKDSKQRKKMTRKAPRRPPTHGFYGSSSWISTPQGCRRPIRN